MTTLQIGNEIGVAARAAASQHIATVAANAGAGSFSTLTPQGAGSVKFKAGTPIDCYSPAGVLRFANRTVVYAIDNGGASLTVAYSGADAPTVAAGDLVYLAGTRINNASSNINGGLSAMQGLRLEGSDTLENMRLRLKTLNPTLYTDAHLNSLTWNDMVYALRLAQEPGSI